MLSIVKFVQGWVCVWGGDCGGRGEGCFKLNINATENAA